MTDACVLDASALLAMLNAEAGADVVATAIGGSVMSTVNWAEVVQKTAEHGLAADSLAGEMRVLGLEIVPFDVATAEAAASLWMSGARSISLADRACLATARSAGLRVLTADRAWKALDLGIDIQTIR